MAVPKHKVYASDGATLVYTIEDVMRRDPVIAKTVPDFVEHTNLRSSGSIQIPGGNKPYDITLYARLAGANYTELINNLESLTSTVLINTNYYLKFDKSLTNDGDLESIKVRLLDITVDTSRGNLTRWLYYSIVFRALAWQ